MRTSVVVVWLAAALGLLPAGPAAAQRMTLEPSAAVGCLTPAAAERGAPDYPFAAFKLGTPGRVKVSLQFSAPDSRPVVKVLEHDGGDSFVEAVENHVRAFRVPCHDGIDTPVTLLFDFVFRSDSRKVHWSPPTDGDDAQRQAQLACVVHTSGAKAPAYPPAARRAGLQGRVPVRLRYQAADKPPVVEMLPRLAANAPVHLQRQADILSRPIEDWALGYRMPCYQGQPLTVRVDFIYVFEGEGYGFKPGMTLQTLLPLVRDIRKQRLAFDFTQMGCPFDVTLQYLQPRLDNLVGELGTPDPARQPFLRWLAALDFDLPEESLDAIYADTTQFTVPCIKIDLNPQE